MEQYSPPPRDERLIRALKNKKIYVYISNYGKLSRKMEELTELFKEEQIMYYVFKEPVTWVDLGDLSNRNRSVQELKEQFLKCNSDCLSYLNGELHFCPHSSHGKDLGKIPVRKGDYLDLLNISMTEAKQLRSMMRRFIYNRPAYITACNYCNKGTDKQTAVESAVQVKK